MADAAAYADWIVKNQDRRGTPEFETVAKAYQAARQQPTAAQPTAGDLLKSELLGSVPGAMLRGVKDVIDTGAQLAASGFDKITGGGEGDRVRAMNEAGKAEFDAATGGAIVPAVARVGGNIIGTLPLTAAAGAGLGAAGLTRLGQAVVSGGMTTGAAPLNMLARVGDLGIRALGGGISGGIAAGAVNPDDAGTGAGIGAAIPVVARAAGALGSAVGNAIRGPAVPDNIRAAAQAAQQAGLVIPPTQARPNLLNRALEGFSGKITTAQNASARNSPVFNQLAKAAIGADELSTEGLRAVRRTANEAYDDLAAATTTFNTDDAFRAAVRKLGASTEQMKRDFPELVDNEVEKLVASVTERDRFGSQSVIEAIKRLRASGSANRAAQDPAKKALGKSQMGIANELENLVDRNLERSGQAGLLDAYRQARTTLAKAYDVEKALNPASGNVDALKLAGIQKKSGRLTGELKQIADFASTFPKAAQPVERMGSLPQVSPLDFGALGAMSAATANPALMAGVLARPAARATVLSPLIQRGLGAAPAQPMNLLSDEALQQVLYRSAPVLAAQR